MTALKKARVIDLTEVQSIYGAKLLADLGADVIRPELKEGDRLRQKGPIQEENGISLWYAYFGTNRRVFRVDTENAAETAKLQSLTAKADIVLFDSESSLADFVNLDRAKAENPKLVVVECSAFGPTGPWKDYKAPDLVAAALGGSAALTGDVATPPLKLWGDLTFAVSGTYVAIAALAGLYHARQENEGQSVQIPVHECIASCLEHALMWYFCHEQFPQSTDRVLPRRGSLHWTDLYHVMQTKAGSVMVTPLPGTDTQLAWMIEEDAFEDLLDPQYQEPGNHRQYALRMMELLRKWGLSKEATEWFEEAQERHLPYGIVNHVDQVCGHPQLEARDWWTHYTSGEQPLLGTGSPYRFSKTPISIRTEPAELDLEYDVDGIRKELGWE